MPEPASLPAIAFIGTGIMGGPMAGHLLAAGHPLHLFNRTPAKAEPLVAQGGTWHDSAEAAAAAGNIVITMLGLPEDVEAVYFGGSGSPGGSSGILAAAREHALLIDMTTSSPDLAARIAAAAADRGIAAIDAPVSGGDIGAKNATLTIMAGGEEDAFARALPVLERLGKSVTRLGAAGAGQRCKLANQVAVAVGMVAWCEALTIAAAGGLDAVAVQRVISGGAAGSWAVSNLAPRALAGDVSPGFLVQHLVKDLRIARHEADTHGLVLPGLAVAEQLYNELLTSGHGNDGTQVLLSHLSPRRED